MSDEQIDALRDELGSIRSPRPVHGGYYNPFTGQLDEQPLDLAKYDSDGFRVAP